MMVTGTISSAIARTDVMDRADLTAGANPRSPIELAYLLSKDIRRIALRITRSDSAAHDVTQEVFVRVLTRGGYDPSKATPEVWVHIVAHNTAIDWLRRETAHRRRLAQSGAIHTATIPVVEETVTARLEANHLQVAVAQLPDVERAVVELAYFGGLSYRQVAQQLGLAEGTVKSRIRRALTRLARLVGPESPTPE